MELTLCVEHESICLKIHLMLVDACVVVLTVATKTGGNRFYPVYYVFCAVLEHCCQTLGIVLFKNKSVFFMYTPL